MNVIYAYKRKDIDKIVYVGQSIELNTRHNQHILYDPYNSNTKEYNYPLSRGIRKYGPDNYELIILEDNILPLDLDEREQYWITYYDTYWHGYNQTPGGKLTNATVYPDDIINLTIEMLKDDNFNYKDIQEKTGLSFTHIYNINIGERRPQPNIKYPIRSPKTKGTKGLLFSEEENKKIHSVILNTTKTFSEIAKEFNCDASTIRRINSGKTKKYQLLDYNYPLRKNPKSVAKHSYWENK